jgi:hypothetical protein
MVDHGGEQFSAPHAGIQALEAHCQGRSLDAARALIEAAALKRRHGAPRSLADTITAVEEANANLVATKSPVVLQRARLRRDEAVSIGAQGGVEAGHQLLDRTAGAVAIILELVVGNDVGVQTENGSDRFGLLSLILLQIIGAPRGGEAAGGSREAAAIAIEEVGTRSGVGMPLRRTARLMAQR